MCVCVCVCVLSISWCMAMNLDLCQVSKPPKKLFIFAAANDVSSKSHRVNDIAVLEQMSSLSVHLPSISSDNQAIYTRG